MADPTPTYDPYQTYETDKRKMLAVLNRYARQWKWFMLSLILGLAGAYVFTQYMPSVYQVQASVMIIDEKKGNSDASVLKEQQIFVPKKVVENEVEVLRSYSLMSQVVKNLHLDVQYFQPARFGKKDIYGQTPVELRVETATPALYKKPLELIITDSRTVTINGQPYPVNQRIQTPYGRLRLIAAAPLQPLSEPITVQVSPTNRVTSGYLKALTVAAASKTSSIVMLTLEETVPNRGEAVLKSLIDAYSQAAVADKNRLAMNALKLIDDRLRSLSGELTAVERDVQNYKSTKGITDLSAQSQSFLQTLQQNDAQLNQVRVQQGALDEVENYVKGKAGARGIVPTTMGLNDPVLLSLVNKASELELQRDQLARTTTAQNPLLQTLDGQIKATKASIGENIESMKGVLISTEEQYMATGMQLEGKIRTVPGKERDLLTITRQQGTKNNLYLYLLQKREETAISYAAAASEDHIVDAPHADDEPIKPKKLIFFALFGIIGLILPLVVMIVRDLTNNQIKERADVENSTSLPILGEVMQATGKQPLIFSTQNQSLITDQIRTLRSNLQTQADAGKTGMVALVTSGNSGEGKSFLSMNLGISLALINRPTIILEMDLRKPKLSELLGVENSTGISNYLAGSATLDDIIQPVPGYSYYWIISSGSDLQSPAELLSSPRLGQLMDQLRQHFSYVLIDSPPVGFVTDAFQIAPFADTTLYVVRPGQTSRSQLKNLSTLQTEKRLPKLNIVLNGVAVSKAYQKQYRSYTDYVGPTSQPTNT